MMGRYSRIKEFWVNAGKIRVDKDGLRPTARDPYLQLLIENAIYPYLRRSHSVLDIGCGDAVSTIKFSEHVKSVTGLDYSESLLRLAKKNIRSLKRKNIRLLNLDITNIPESVSRGIDSIISIRCLINLPSEELQYSLLNDLWRILPKKGYLFISEGYKQGLTQINAKRRQLGLKDIKIVSYNKYFDQIKFEKFIKTRFKVIALKKFGLYSLLSRAVFPALILPRQPKHDSLENKTFMKLQSAENWPEFEDYGYNWLYVLEKRGVC